MAFQQKGTKAPQAAGRIHTDFEKGFIMAEVMKFEDFKEEGSEAACKVTHLHITAFVNLCLIVCRKVQTTGKELCGGRRGHHSIQIQCRRRTFSEEKNSLKMNSILF